jgi:hypothetical protein
MNEPTTSPITGLSEDEAQRRRSQREGDDAQVKTGRFYGRIVRDNVPSREQPYSGADCDAQYSSDVFTFTDIWRRNNHE